MSDLITRLSKTDPFRYLERGRLDQLISGSRLLSVPKRSVIYRAGTSYPDLVLLLTGSLQSVETCSSGRVRAISLIRPNQMVGLLHVFGPLEHRDSLVAIEDSSVVLIDKAKTAKLLIENPIAASAVCALLSQTICNLKQERMLLARAESTGRILGVLSQFIKKEEGRTLLANLPKQQEIADLANTTRETVSRTISQLANTGVIKKMGSQIEVAQPEVFT
jgi:CRP/FNR family transcriptional regulator, cyclic AMP receptor protein